MRRLLVFAAALLVPALTVLAQLPPTAPSANSGSLVITGDETLIPLVQNQVVLYQLDGFTGSATVSAAPVADAFVSLCAGNQDLVLATRLITAAEQAACVANGATPLGFQIGTDALIIVASPQNNFLQNLTTDQLRLAFTSAFNWNEVDGAFPATPINRYLPTQDRGEFQFFVGALFGGDPTGILTATNSTSSADFNQLLQLIANDTAGIGLLPASLANRNSSLARAVQVNGIAPNTQAVVNGQYPFARPLLVYTLEQTFRARPTVADFLNYLLTNAPTETQALGLYPASDSLRAAAISTWLRAAGISPTPTPPAALPTVALPPTLDPALMATALAPLGTPAVTPAIPVTFFNGDTLALLVNARADLETLANNVLGVRRPEGWSGSLDTANPQLALLIRLDLETLAGSTVGVNARPEGWFGAVPSSAFSIARDIRHDLELLADTLLESTSRPQGWVGADPVFTCDRATQALADLLLRTGIFTLDVDPAAADYCAQVTNAVAVFTETNILTLPEGGLAIAVAQDEAGPRGRIRIDTRFAVAFFNRAATQRAGVIPEGTSVRALGRSPARFSNMLLVEGDGFLLYVDYNDTTLSTVEFRALRNAEPPLRDTFCNTEFCQP